MIRRLKNRARLLIDSIFCSNSPHIRRVGCKDSGWVIDTRLPVRVAYCAGVGQGMSFEVELAKMAAHPVLVFDPSPTGIHTAEKTTTENLVFLPIGMASHAGTIEFSIPKDPGEGSYSVVQDGIQTVSFECHDLPTIMRRYGHDSIDILKMDIEGFEYDIIDQMLNDKIPVRQLCVEFHHWLRPGQTYKTIARLYRAGYRVIHKSRGDYSFLHINSNVR